MAGQTAGWDRLRLRLRSTAPPLYPPRPGPPGSLPPSCDVCRGPVRPGFARCYQCGLHDLLGRGLLADAVVPISYAIRGTAFADDLWRYKWWQAPAASAQASVLAVLLAFLADHGACVWRHAEMPPPGRLAVVPTGAGRPGPHPLFRLVSPYLRLPACPLAIRPGRQGRDLDLDRDRARPVPACCCWTTRGYRAPAPSRPPPRSSRPVPATSRLSCWVGTSTRMTPSRFPCLAASFPPAMTRRPAPCTASPPVPPSTLTQTARMGVKQRDRLTG
jgi:hypothetical protein